MGGDFSSNKKAPMDGAQCFTYSTGNKYFSLLLFKLT